MEEEEVEMEEEVARQPKSRTIKEEFEVNEQLKEELSQPSAQPIKHNPEGNAKKEHFKISPKRKPSTIDLIFQQINK